MRDLLIPLAASALVHGAIVVALPGGVDGPRIERVASRSIEVVLTGGSPAAAAVEEPSWDGSAPATSTTARAVVPDFAPAHVADRAPHAPGPSRGAADRSLAGTLPDRVGAPAPGLPDQAVATDAIPARSASTSPPHDLPRLETESAEQHAATAGSRGDRGPAVPAGLNEPPAYPALARRAGHEGTVLLRVLVSADGAGERVLVHRSSGSQLLDRAAVRAVATWRFQPARRGGTPTTEWLEVPIEFHLKDR